jgi:hypothetical protein
MKYSTREVDQHKKKLKEKPNISKKANIVSKKFPLPITTHLYSNSTNPVLRTDVKNIWLLIHLLDQSQNIDMKLKLSKTIKLKFSLKLLNTMEQL